MDWSSWASDFDNRFERKKSERWKDWEIENKNDPIHSDFFDSCKNIPSGFCQDFHQSIGFNNLWLGYVILVVFCLILAAIYAVVIRCKFPDRTYVIKWHVGIFLVNVTIWFWTPCLILIAVCNVSIFCGFIMITIPLVALCFVLMGLDLMYSPEAKHFKNQKEAQETSLFLERLKAAKPAVSVKISCYHYARWKRELFEREVVTFTERRFFPIDGFIDESQTPSRINSNVTLFHIFFSISAGDQYSHQAFNQFKNRYIAANSHRDQAMKTKIEQFVPGFLDDGVMTVKGTPPWWANICWFYILSALNASILLRILLRTRSTRINLLVQKKFIVDPAIQRTYDFDTGLAGPSVVNNFIMPPQQGYGQPQPQQYPTGSSTQQHFQPFTSDRIYAPTPPQFGQPGLVSQQYPDQGYPGAMEMEKQPFIEQVEPVDPPPAYNPNF